MTLESKNPVGKEQTLFQSRWSKTNRSGKMKGKVQLSRSSIDVKVTQARSRLTNIPGSHEGMLWRKMPLKYDRAS
jgi:hypothetical protein